MKIGIKIIPGAKVEQIQEGITGDLKVWVREKAIEGRANNAMINLLSEYYHVPKSSIRILQGLKSRNKLIEISN